MALGFAEERPAGNPTHRPLTPGAFVSAFAIATVCYPRPQRFRSYLGGNFSDTEGFFGNTRPCDSRGITQRDLLQPVARIST